MINGRLGQGRRGRSRPVGGGKGVGWWGGRLVGVGLVGTGSSRRGLPWLAGRGMIRLKPAARSIVRCDVLAVLFLTVLRVRDPTIRLVSTQFVGAAPRFALLPTPSLHLNLTRHLDERPHAIGPAHSTATRVSLRCYPGRLADVVLHLIVV